ncbi:protein-glutamine gamma-glutamyltransferase [Paenibacillus dakarensis]|uniref:protein-glutamine gamma-glutamyltransferase n=1 Tax=Paenibacillus dakarensis TaxID=1527293 RepID=UPI0006D5892B|nr:protein-glutamine gamma-glutamyltransferase [Paenibacillus dakarensis]
MIQIMNGDIGQINASTLTELERSILQQKQNSPVVYRYPSPDALRFELRMRSHIVGAAIALDASNAAFATFKTSKANERFWYRREDGGLQQRPDVRSSDALNDIFVNGRLYGFECATAMVVILYKAVLDTIGEEAFNIYFQNLLLYDWQYDRDLPIRIIHNKNEAYPGDVVYFANPDFNPLTPQWRGENAIVLSTDRYFGHGIGVRNGEEMILSLNRRRIPGSTTSAYLTDQINYLDFEYLRRLNPSYQARIGVRRYYLV